MTEYNEIPVDEQVYLMIDDMRDFGCDLKAKTSKEARTLWKENHETITHLVLANDLGEDQDMEGWQLLEWAIGLNIVPENVLISSANPVARKRIDDILKFDLKYNLTGQGWWRKPK